MENEIFEVIVVFGFQHYVTIHNLYPNSLPVFHFIFILILMKDRIVFPLLLSKQTSQMLLCSKPITFLLLSKLLWEFSSLNGSAAEILQLSNLITLLLLVFSVDENLGSWRNGISEETAQSPGPASDAPQGTLVLAAKRTNRPDILSRFKRYRGGWDIANRHYWAVSLGSFLSFNSLIVIYEMCAYLQSI